MNYTTRWIQEHFAQIRRQLLHLRWLMADEELEDVLQSYFLRAISGDLFNVEGFRAESPGKQRANVKYLICREVYDYQYESAQNPVCREFWGVRTQREVKNGKSLRPPPPPDLPAPTPEDAYLTLEEELQLEAWVKKEFARAPDRYWSIVRRRIEGHTRQEIAEQEGVKLTRMGTIFSTLQARLDWDDLQRGCA